MKICFFGIYDPNYSRNSILLLGLKQAGVEVIECWADWRDPKRYRRLWRQLRALHNQYDCIYAAYPSPVPTILARLMSKRPIIADAFYSMYDSVVNDRRKFSRWHPRSIKLLILDWLGVWLANIVITDTEQHQQYWSEWRGIDKNKIHTVYLGINDKKFYPVFSKKKDYILVHFHGTYIPLQGALKIIEAAWICASDSRIRFRLIGDGREFPLVKKFAEKHGLKNVEFVGQVPLAELNTYLAEADIVLGIFGYTDKAQRVIPNKVYEGLAAKRAVITTDTAAVREIFSNEELLLVKNDPQSIADGIMLLVRDERLRADLAGRGYVAVLKYTPQLIGKQLVGIIRKNLSNV